MVQSKVRSGPGPDHAMALPLTPATAHDRGWLDQLRRAVYADLFVATWGAWDEERHLRHLASCLDRGSIQLVEVAGERVGMLQVLEDDHALEVAEIQIAPAHQGRGIGSRLLREVITRAHRAGKPLALSTGLQNHRAISLYHRLGLRETRRTETHVHLSIEP